MLLNPVELHVPKTLPEALELYARFEHAKLQAGGTFLINSLKLLKRNGVKTPEHIISLQKVDELKGISFENDSLIIKSMTTIDDLAASPYLKDKFSVLKIVCKDISTQPIRNVATVGGNLTCRYTWTEMPAAMIGLDAKLHFTGKDKKEDVMSAEDFFKAQAKTDKIFTHVSIQQDKQVTIAYRRVKKTVNVDIPMLSLMITTHFEGKKFTRTRVSVNNCVTFAQRDVKLEEFLNKSTYSARLPEEALEHTDSVIYDNRADDYKKHMFRLSIKNAIKELGEKAK
jgi:CO/xanthine dehydrogenase FAD-binding subunit